MGVTSEMLNDGSAETDSAAEADGGSDVSVDDAEGGGKTVRSFSTEIACSFDMSLDGNYCSPSLRTHILCIRTLVLSAGMCAISLLGINHIRVSQLFVFL